MLLLDKLCECFQLEYSSILLHCLGTKSQQNIAITIILDIEYNISLLSMILAISLLY